MWGKIARNKLNNPFKIGNNDGNGVTKEPKGSSCQERISVPFIFRAIMKNNAFPRLFATLRSELTLFLK